MGYYNTFVVKIWCQDTGELNKGHVQHVSTQEERYFLDMDDLTAFIRGHLSPPTDESVMGNKVLGEQKLTENLKDIL